MKAAMESIIRTINCREISLFVFYSTILGVAMNFYRPEHKRLSWEYKARVVQMAMPSDIGSVGGMVESAIEQRDKADRNSSTNLSPIQTEISSKNLEIAASERLNIDSMTKRDNTLRSEVPEAFSEPKGINFEQAKKLFLDKNTLFIDARNDAEHAEGHISGGIHIFAQDIQQHIPKIFQIPRDQRIVVYCNGGDCDLSHELAGQLVRQFQKKYVYVYLGGWNEWKEKMK